ncbi:MAG TPA: hypothetical protein VM347_34665 [Nonomuraea sp.]|nr:hypothetical protein [Nonomuraea sp.]
MMSGWSFLTSAADLPMQVGLIFRDVSVIIGQTFTPRGMQSVNGKVRVMPVEQRVVEAHAEPSAAEGLDDRADQVLSVRRAGHRVVGERGVPQAEAVVVLGREHHVPHPGSGGGLGPGIRVEQVGVEVVEVVEVGLVLLIGEQLPRLDPLVASGERVQAPVDEQAEALLLELGQPGRRDPMCCTVGI